MARVIGKVHGPDGSSFTGHSARLRYEADLGDPDATPPTPLLVRLESAGAVEADGDFTLTVADAPIVGTATLAIVSPAGVTITERTVSAEALGDPIVVPATPAAPLPVLPNDEPGTGPRVRLNGRVIDERGHRVPGGLPVVIFGRRVDDAGVVDQDDRVLLVTDTQPGGTFAADWPTDALATAHGVVNGLAPVPIPLSDGRLPLKVLLVVSLPDDEREDCACDDRPHRALRPGGPDDQPGGVLPGHGWHVRRPDHTEPGGRGVRLLLRGPDLGAGDPRDDARHGARRAAAAASSACRSPPTTPRWPRWPVSSTCSVAASRAASLSTPRPRTTRDEGQGGIS